MNWLVMKRFVGWCVLAPIMIATFPLWGIVWLLIWAIDVTDNAPITMRKMYAEDL